MAKKEIESFNIVPPPSKSKINDEILQKSLTDLIYFGRAFLPKDFLNKSKSPPFHYKVAKKLLTTKPAARIYYLEVLVSLYFQKLLLYIRCYSLHKEIDCLLLG